MRLVLALFVALALVAAAGATGTSSSEDVALRAQLQTLVKEYEAVTAAIEANKGWKRPDQFSMAEVDGMLKKSEELQHKMRHIFALIRIRETEQALAHFRASLTEAFNAQGYADDLPKIEAVCKEHYLVLPEHVENLSNNWYERESKDADTKKIHLLEKEYHLLLYDHDWLLRNSERPVPNLEKMLGDLHANRDRLLAWIASPVVGNPRALLEMSNSAEAEETADEQVEAEEAAEADTEEEQSTDASAEEFSFAEAGSKQTTTTKGSEDALLLEVDIEGGRPDEAEEQADAEFGQEDSYDALDKEAKALDAMAHQFEAEGLVL